MQHTLEQVRKAAQDIVASKPEGFGYKDVHEGWHPRRFWADFHLACKYVIDDKPGCIVGQVAHALGTPVSTLEQYEAHDANTLPFFFRDAGEYLKNMQESQDKGVTWALAYQAAEELLIVGTRITNGERDR